VRRLKSLVSNPTVKVVDPDLPYIALEHLEVGTGRLLPGVELEGKDAEDSVGHLPGDVRFGKLRPYLSKSYLAAEKGVGSGELLVLRPGPEIDSRFLWYVTLSQPFVDWANASSYGVKMPRTSWDALGNFQLEVPTVAAQQRVVAFLDAQTARIDELISEFRLAARRAGERSVAAQIRLATGGSGAGGQRDSRVEWLGLVPHHWRVVPLKSVARMESGHTPSRSRPELWEYCSIPWISLNDVGSMGREEFISSTANLISEAGIAESSARLLPAGTVVLSRDATIGRAAIMALPMATSQHFGAWVCGEQLRPRYLWLLFSTVMQPYFDTLTEGSTIRTIGMPELRAFKIPLPPLPEQDEIVEHAARVRGSSVALQDELEQQVALLREHRRSLITSAVTGVPDVVRKVA
jgi:type I restriction enzyme S subunit